MPKLTEMGIIILKKKKSIEVVGDLCVTKKLRETDCINFIKDGKIEKGETVKYWIENKPIELWNLIYKKGSYVSLVSPAYTKLRAVICKLDYSLIEKLNTAHSKRKTLKKLNEYLSIDDKNKKGSFTSLNGKRS